MNQTKILGILISDRLKEAEKVQKILTKYGCIIKTRLGIHEASDTICAKKGLLLLELTGKKNEGVKMEKELSKISGMQIKKMVFNY